MFRPTSRQTSMLASQFLMPPEKRERLEQSWAEVFRTQILGLIDEEPFRACFADEIGRPNKSIRLLVGLLLLKEADDLTDAQVVEQLEFNLQWQHALGVGVGDAHVAQKTLHNFRKRLLENDRAQGVFNQVTRAMATADGLSLVRQRLDSTHIISNIAVLSRLGLFVETVALFLRTLRANQPESFAALPAKYAERYLDREGHFSDAKREQAARRLPVVAKDIHELITRFQGQDSVTTLAPYLLLARLFAEQCQVVPADAATTGSEERVELREGVDISADSLQSPHDPDATYGHKGKGFEAHVTETCVPENAYQVVTDVALNGAHVSDKHAVEPLVARLQEKGLAPEEMLADTTYSGGENIVMCAEQGIELVAPVQDPKRTPPVDPWLPQEEATPDADQGKPPSDGFGVEKFTFSDDYQSIVACPVGNAPRRQWGTHGGTRVIAEFRSSDCADCLLASMCPAKPRGRGGWRVGWRPAAVATAVRQTVQRTPEFKERYRLRSGIEATHSRLKHQMGAANLRVRGQPRVSLLMVFKALALNVQRKIAYHLAPLASIEGTPCPG